MELFFIIILIVGIYWIYRKSSEKTPAQDELSLALNTPHPQLSDDQKQLLLTLFTSYTSDDYSVGKRFEELISSKSDRDNLLIEKVKRVHKKYTRLNERYKNNSIAVRWGIVDDWSNYLYAVNRIDFYKRSGKFIVSSHKKDYKGKLDQEYFDNRLEETKIQIEEIERRFDGRLSKNN